MLNGYKLIKGKSYAFLVIIRGFVTSIVTFLASRGMVLFCLVNLEIETRKVGDRTTVCSCYNTRKSRKLRVLRSFHDVKGTITGCHVVP